MKTAGRPNRRRPSIAAVHRTPPSIERRPALVCWDARYKLGIVTIDGVVYSVRKHYRRRTGTLHCYILTTQGPGPEPIGRFVWAVRAVRGGGTQTRPAGERGDRGRQREVAAAAAKQAGKPCGGHHHGR